MEGLTTGRIVHYVSSGPLARHLAAIVSRVDAEGTVTLHIFNPYLGDVVVEKDISYSANGDPGTWHWIERA